MADFTLEHQFQSNFQISITLESLRFEGWNFQRLIISTLSTNSEKMNKIWEVRVSTYKNIGWFDMELPRIIISMSTSLVYVWEYFLSSTFKISRMCVSIRRIFFFLSNDLHILQATSITNENITNSTIWKTKQHKHWTLCAIIKKQKGY